VRERGRERERERRRKTEHNTGFFLGSHGHSGFKISLEFVSTMSHI